MEVTTLIIPTLNDSSTELENIAKFILEGLIKNTPWHVSTFARDFLAIAAFAANTEDKIKQAYQIGKKIGLNYVYGGNIDDAQLENTYCPIVASL